MKTKIISIFLILTASVGTMFAEKVQIGDLYYNLDATNQTAEVTSQNSGYPYWSTSITTANIPSSVEYNSVSYSVTSIGRHAFSGCSGLTSVTIGNSVTSIGNSAFSGCSGLTSVTIGNSVTSIGNSAFSGCTGLTSVIWNAKNCADFASNSTPFYDLHSQITSFTFGNEVEYIPAYLCNGMSNLTSIEIPNSVTSIGHDAFRSCTGLTSVTIPNSVTSIGYQAFFDCCGLTSPVYNAHVFAKMPTSYSGAYTIPDGIKSIAGNAFYKCSGLTSVTIPYSVTSIGDRAFWGCTGLASVTIPNSVTSIGDGAFAFCYGLASIDVASDNSNYCSADGVLFNKDKTTLIQYPGGKQGAYTIPNSVTSIGEEAFHYCTSLASITIPNSVTSIGDYAFRNCTSLTSITIPNSVTSIGYQAFFDCCGLTSVTIPNSVTSIGGWAFRYCSGLTSILNYANTPQEINSYVFDLVDKTTCILYVPLNSVDLYKAAEGWKEFGQILPISAKETETTETTVETTETSAEITWPSVSGAYTYELIIKDQSGNIICTLVFDSEGRLKSITFLAPGRNRALQQPQTAGFSFTVTSLDSGTTYSYTMTAKGNNGNVLKTESGSFTTTGDPQGIDDIQGEQAQSTKILRNGQIFILRGEKEYTLTGQEVK